MNTLFSGIIEDFKQHENEEAATLMKAYMRNNFEFLGIHAPVRKTLSKPIIFEVSKASKSLVYSLIKGLWKRPEREFHYLALELYFALAKKKMEESDLEFIEILICENSWWDTVDFIAPKIVRMYFDKFPTKRDKVVDSWILSGNVWLQRSALLFQLKQKDEVDLHFMFSVILQLSGGKEFFINKAIGWLLREHSKRIPTEILLFITENKRELSSLSVREGLKLC